MSKMMERRIRKFILNKIVMKNGLIKALFCKHSFEKREENKREIFLLFRTWTRNRVYL